MRRAGPETDVAALPRWPSLSSGAGRVRADGQLLAGFELAALNLELLAEVEREASLEALAALYDAIPRPFQLLSVPAARDPNDHLSAMQAGVAGRRAKTAFASYAALYRELAAAPWHPLRATYLIVSAASEPELRRITELVRRVGEERGVELRHLTSARLTALWSSVAAVGGAHRLSVHTARAEDVMAAVVFGRRWPSRVPPGWLSGLLASAGLKALSMRVRPLSRAEAMSFMTARLRHVRASERLAAERGEIEDPERERVGATALAARRAAQTGQGRTYLADTVLLVGAPDRATLHERIEAIRLEARSQQLEVELASFRVAQAWQGALPGPHRRPLTERNLDTNSLTASLLHTSSDLYEPSGHLYGRQRSSGAPIVLDRFARPSHNAIVLGQTGTGKTMFTGAEMSRCFLRGIRVLGVDPLGDFRRLAQELGGTYLELGTPGVGLNPFALSGASDPAAFGAKLAMLSRLVTAMAGGLSRDEQPALDRAMRAAYDTAHIGPDPATFDRRPPTLTDLVANLADEPGGKSLARRLERWASGSLSDVLGTDVEMPLDRRMLVVGLAAIGDDEVRAVAQFATLSVLWDAVRRDLSPKLVVIDETWKVMRQASGAKFVEELARSARHYHAGLHLATQDIVEFLRSDFGETIVKQCDIRVLLGQTPEAADALTRYFDLTPTERRVLLHARPGEGLLFVGRSHAAFEATVSRREYAVLTTRPADLIQPAVREPIPDTS
ncbi:MAG: VirB4 family type IV secretion system protein [Candidatus Limnocylindria bacterium]